MNIFVVIVLGLVQGLSEFLPISSSGHLILVRSMFGITGDYLLFDIALHVGTLLAVCICFYKEILALLRPPYKRLLYLVLATIPAVIVGLLLRHTVDNVASNPQLLPLFFMITAIILLLTNMIIKRQADTKPLDIKISLAMGLAQAVAIVPGISRSGSTIAGGIASGGSRKEVAVFSFLMSIPIILGSLVLESVGGITMDVDIGYVLVGMVVSFASGYLAIRTFMRVIQRANLNWFALYLVVVSIITFVAYFVI